MATTDINNIYNNNIFFYSENLTRLGGVTSSAIAHNTCAALSVYRYLYNTIICIYMPVLCILYFGVRASDLPTTLRRRHTKSYIIGAQTSDASFRWRRRRRHDGVSAISLRRTYYCIRVVATRVCDCRLLFSSPQQLPCFGSSPHTHKRDIILLHVVDALSPLYLLIIDIRPVAVHSSRNFTR